MSSRSSRSSRSVTPNAALAPGGTGLSLGPLQVRTPVVLAPMAGITNAAYRRLCREQGAGHREQAAGDLR